MASCSTVGVASGAVRHALVWAIGPQALEGAIPTDVRHGLVNAAAAILFVIAGAMVAPRFRMIVAIALYGVGACVAWIVLGAWYFPEGHPRAYQVSHVPLSLTLIGGLVGVLLTFILVDTRAWSHIRPRR